MNPIAWVLLGFAVGAFVISIVHLFVVSRQIRPDAQRKFAKWSTPFYFAEQDLTVDAFTEEGNRSRRMLVWYSILWVYLAFCGLTARGLGEFDSPASAMFFGGIGIAATLLLIALDGRHMIARAPTSGSPAATAESAAAVASAPPDDPTYGPRFRQRCPCCGFLTLGMSAGLCYLCDWDGESDDERTPDAAQDSPRFREAALHDARKNFERFLTADDLSNPQPWMHAPSSRELELKREIMHAFTQLEHDKALDSGARWHPIFALEHELATEQDREQEEAE